MDIYLGQIARDLRESLGLTQRAAAEELGISHVHLCNIERNHAAPSQELVDRYRELWGVDLHVMAWCTKGNVKLLPKGLRKVASELAKEWQGHVDLIAERQSSKATS